MSQGLYIFHPLNSLGFRLTTTPLRTTTSREAGIAEDSTKTRQKRMTTVGRMR